MTKRTVHENPWFSISLTEAGEQRWYRVERADSALLIGTGDQGRFLMIHGVRDTTGTEPLYEFPCGGIDPSEDPASAAVRETREETGWEATDLTPLGSFVEAPGISPSRCFVFAGRVSPGGEASLEPGEEWTPVTVSTERLKALIAEGRVQDAGTLAALALHSARESADSWRTRR
ncbi:NUDIX hydrolase [Labedella phragmitis]|uniref:NUDIX hydrolase n=1 Tax=Labedella phragmitis TaxID=2498849 RepID=A0A3S3ZCR7_9MICO|nr:NUDIX hydrolase [Labedella phragmitis]RWZ52675.1 NUDIX hydrolase [Labedella phragmitis]